MVDITIFFHVCTHHFASFDTTNPKHIASPSAVPTSPKRRKFSVLKSWENGENEFQHFLGFWCETTKKNLLNQPQLQVSLKQMVTAPKCDRHSSDGVRIEEILNRKNMFCMMLYGCLYLKVSML
jgi:hypothetical protein